MRGENQTQMYCISETNAAIFELRMNEALRNLVDPEIRLDPVRSFTAYIFYKIERTIPESIEDALVMIEGEHHYCDQCPSFIPPDDGRKKWGYCESRLKKVRLDSLACIDYYKLRNAPEMITSKSK
ncbi:MAG: hypothetical protein II918_02455 [Firmicutes bacterium]|nr:hypothetical protein [Bacillota bacterium]